MNSSNKTKQIIVIGAIVLLVGFLFSRDIKGLEKEEEHTEEQASVAPSNAAQITIEQASEASKSVLSRGLSTEIIALENKFKGTTGDEMTKLAEELAQKWDDVEQITPSALYLEIVSNAKPSPTSWLTTGNRFLKAFDSTQDTIAQPILLQKANNAFKNALSLDENNIDAKTGLGVTIVNGMGAPMEGIAMLLEVVEKEPKNAKANLNLGLFSIKSGQFGKAIPRFKTVIEAAPTPDAYFYLATAYENLGQNKEAIEAYLESKKLAANPTLGSFIEKKVAELKNKN